MPPILVAFFILVGAGTVPPVVRGLTTLPDAKTHSKLGKPGRVEYRTWTSSPTRDRKGDCTFTVFAMVTQGARARLRIHGQEQQLDWSWSWDVRVPAGTHGSGMLVEFVDPVSGAVLASREIAETCWYVQPTGGVR